ncbi:hypothetical protein JVX93_16035 [Mycolicibacterium boenickei]|nr:hypothetical protein JVX93_16035 [Mycolicibacterium boenickei]
MSAYSMTSGDSPMPIRFQWGRMRRNAWALVLAAALTLGSAPLAHASTRWAALVWTGDMKTGQFRNYPELTQLVLDVQNWAKDVGYQTFSSGQCGAVATYTDPLGDTRFSPGTGRTRDEATRDAMKPLNARLLDAFCQN